MVKATTSELGEVHSNLADLILEELRFIREHNERVANWCGDPSEAPQRIKLEASLVNSVARFLSDNEVTADPESNDNMKDLRRQLEAQTSRHKDILAKARSLEDDLH